MIAEVQEEDRVSLSYFQFPKLPICSLILVGMGIRRRYRENMRCVEEEKRKRKELLKVDNNNFKFNKEIFELGIEN